MKKRSKRYKATKEKTKDAYSLFEAIKFVKEKATAKFIESVEVHIALAENKGKPEILRGTVLFPVPLGKKIRIAAFVEKDKEKEVKAAKADLIGQEDLIQKIKETKRVDFDLAVAHPSMMRHLASIAKILGPRGLMPSPKTGTVTPHPAKAIAELKAGKTSFKSDPQGVIHQIIGKVSMPDDKLEQNFKALMERVKKAGAKEIKSVVLCSTMGPGIKVKF